ncbi:MAG: hypothetical protein ACT4P7_17325 [Gemmatimonadaceae bacterium]
MIADVFRPPPLLDPTRARYKDWLHLNVFDHASGMIGLFNGSLHGPPDDDRSCILGTALVHHPDYGWVGNTEVGGYEGTALGVASVALHDTAIALEPDGRVRASVAMPRDALHARCAGRPLAPSLDIELPLPFGDGWISWRVVPALSLQGDVSLGERTLPLDGAAGYHDHNWGRWRWGDDLGWEWGAFAAVEHGPVIVVTRTTDRAHRLLNPALLTVDAGPLRRTFSGGQVEMTTAGRLQERLRRLPGALAALHESRRSTGLPSNMVVRADDGWSRVDLRFTARAAAQLIAAEPTSRGYSFIHELVGTFTARWEAAGTAHRIEGLGVFEYVC